MARLWWPALSALGFAAIAATMADIGSSARTGEIVFQSGRDGGSRVAVVRSDGTGFHELTHGLLPAVRPVWLPNADKIVVDVVSPGGAWYTLSVIDVRRPREMSLARDGRTFAFANTPTSANTGPIMVARIDGGAPRRVATGRLPVISPDGRWLAFARADAEGAPGIWVVSTQGGRPRQVGRGSNVSWAPDSSQLAYTCPSGFSEQGELCVSNRDGVGRTVSSFPRLHKGALSAPVWSPSGRLYFAVSGDRFRGLWVVQANGSGLRKLAAGEFGALSVSSQGRLAIAGSGGTIWTSDAHGRSRTRLISPTFDRVPRWSPNGSEVAFIRTTQIGGSLSGLLHLMRSDGTSVRSIHHGISRVSWSPDGQTLLGVADHGLLVLSRTGAVARSIRLNNQHGEPFEFEQAEWSPNGQTIAALVSDTEQSRPTCTVLLLDASGHRRRLLTQRCLNADAIAWAHDGRKLLFVSGGTLSMIGRDGSNLHAVVSSGSDSIEGAIWSPNDAMIAFAPVTTGESLDSSLDIVAATGKGRRTLIRKSEGASNPDWR